MKGIRIASCQLHSGIIDVERIDRMEIYLLIIIRGMQIAAIHQMILPDGIPGRKDPSVDAI